MTNPIDSRLAEEWHPVKNGVLLPTDFSAGSGKKVWWLGKRCSHEWEAIILNRGKGYGCPYCSGKSILVGFNDLGTTHPELSLQWHSSLNKELLPTQVSHGSRRKIWWQDDKGHIWQAEIANRTSGGQSCPYCSGKRVLAGFNDISTTHPDIAKQWHPSKNNKEVTEYSAGSSQKVWWQCDKGHDYMAIISNRRLGDGCSYCANRKILIGFNDLATTHPTIALDWSETNKLSPTQVSAGSHSRIQWKCSKNHEWITTVNSRTQGAGCPYCSSRFTDIGRNDLKTFYPQIFAQLHSSLNKDIDLEKLAMKSNKKVWWQCDFQHVWDDVVYHRVSGRGCPVCSNRRILPGFNDLATTHSHLVKEWHQEKNGSLSPQNITAGSDVSIWWICEDDHVWKAAAYTRKNGHNCPLC